MDVSYFCFLGTFCFHDDTWYYCTKVSRNLYLLISYAQQFAERVSITRIDEQIFKMLHENALLKVAKRLLKYSPTWFSL